MLPSFVLLSTILMIQETNKLCFCMQFTPEWHLTRPRKEPSNHPAYQSTERTDRFDGLVIWDIAALVQNRLKQRQIKPTNKLQGSWSTFKETLCGSGPKCSCVSRKSCRSTASDVVKPWAMVLRGMPLWHYNAFQFRNIKLAVKKRKCVAPCVLVMS